MLPKKETKTIGSLEIPTNRSRWLSFPRRHPWLSLIIAVFLAAGGYRMLSGGSVTTTRPLLATVEIGDIENAVIAAGYLQPSNFVDVGAQVSGQLEVLHIEVGDAVVEGQTLNANQQTPIILRIADLTTMTVEAQVSEADVTKLRPGMEVYFTTLGGGWQSEIASR